jgi:hypothetical protein
MKPTFTADLSLMYCRYVDMYVTENGLVATTVATIMGTSLPLPFLRLSQQRCKTEK